MERYRTQYGISNHYFGIRQVAAYEEPFKFNIAVNYMSDVMKHKDAELSRDNNYGIQSSLSNATYSVRTKSKIKGYKQ